LVTGYEYQGTRRTRTIGIREKEVNTAMAKVILDVPDISCEHCERAITKALQGEPGVASVKVDIPTKKVYLEYDPSELTLDKVRLILDDEGYPVKQSQPA
jgi:copper chaperone